MCLGNYYAMLRGFLFLQPERLHRSLRSDPADINDWSVWHSQAAHSQQILKPTVATGRGRCEETQRLRLLRRELTALWVHSLLGRGLTASKQCASSGDFNWTGAGITAAQWKNLLLFQGLFPYTKLQSTNSLLFKFKYSSGVGISLKNKSLQKKKKQK